MLWAEMILLAHMHVNVRLHESLSLLVYTGGSCRKVLPI
jgi:hypothetical protein